MPKDCPPFSQSMGSGFTNYYLVDDVDVVSDTLLIVSRETRLIGEGYQENRRTGR